MKKLVLVAAFFTLFLTTSFGQTGYTLSGFIQTDAKTMMENFRTVNEPYDKDHRTSFWISKNDFTALYKHLIAIGANGVRVYLAKASKTAPTTLIFVATHSANGFTYSDFFESSKPAAFTVAPSYFVGTTTFFNGATLHESHRPNPVNENCYGDGHHIMATHAFDMAQNLSKGPINIHGELFTLVDAVPNQGFLYDLNDELLNTKNNLSGVRIYVARQTTIKRKDNVTRHCFLFMTTTDLNSIHYDNYECPPSLISKQLRKVKGNNFAIYDNGEECPTACDGSAFYQYP